MSDASRPRSLRAVVGPLVTGAVRRGKTTVLLTGEWARLGNVLFYWLHAHIRQRAGTRYVVRTSEAARPWLDHLPDLARQLTVEPAGVRFYDRREWPPPPDLFQRFGSDFDTGDLDAFVRTFLLGSPLLARPGRPDDVVVVNVRRGDYYSDDKHRRNFGMEIEGYLRQALTRAFARRPHGGVHVVSDDIAWCRDNLGTLLAAFSPAVTYAPPASTGFDDFAALCSARTLICSNSTFSYWGGYVSTVRFGGDAHVIVPAFHARHVNEGVAYQLLSAWDVVDAEGITAEQWRTDVSHHARPVSLGP